MTVCSDPAPERIYMQGMIPGNAVEKPVDMYQKSLLSYW